MNVKGEPHVPLLDVSVSGKIMRYYNSTISLKLDLYKNCMQTTSYNLFSALVNILRSKILKFLAKLFPKKIEK